MNAREPLDPVAGADFAALEHAVVPAGAQRLLNTPRHVVAGKTQIEFPAWLARLRNLHDRGADPVDIADAYVRFRHAERADVFAEPAARGKARKTCHAEAVIPFAAPYRVVIERIVMQCLFRG